MDVNDIRGIHSLIIMAIFLGIIWWAFSAHRKKPNDEAAQLPFEDDDIDQRTQQSEKSENEK
ncbi:MAG: cbb3-type cytochrome c oxidase subunit 3 [Marinobacter sp.]|nr:cbb3-type cytochrome c oxidase subunit 3 [Marinobacter sp.]